MTATQLATALALLGLTRAEAARRLGITYRRLFDYLDAGATIPERVAAHVRCWLRVKALEAELARRKR